MVPQPSQTKRGRLSPSGTRFVRRAPQLLQKFIAGPEKTWRLYGAGAEDRGRDGSNRVGAQAGRKAGSPVWARIEAENPDREEYMMRKILGLALLAVIAASPPAPAQEDAAPAGIWKGPWYRGMTSGTMMLEVSGDGSGSVRFTNLETFGDGPAVLQKTATKAGTYEFAAFGAA